MVDGRRYVRRFRTSRRWDADHGFEHLRGNNTGLTGYAACAYNSTLDRRHFFWCHFHAEITSRHHNGVGAINDSIEMLDCGWLLKFRHDAGAVANDGAKFLNVFRLLDERKCNPINP